MLYAIRLGYGENPKAAADHFRRGRRKSHAGARVLPFSALTYSIIMIPLNACREKFDS